MKQATIFLFTVLFTFSISYAQEEISYGFNKGDFYISGAAKYSGLLSNEFDSNNELFVEPSVGYFISDNISLGVQSELLLTNDFADSYGIGINGRYFFMPKKRFNVFAELAIDYSNFERNFISLQEKKDSFSTAFSTGLNYFITKNLSLFTKFEILDFSYSEYETNSSLFFPVQNQQNFDDQQLRIGPKNLHLGVIYKF